MDLNTLKPFSPILFYDNPSLSSFYMWPCVWGIQGYQRSLFGRKADWASPHVELFLDKAHILNPVPPKVKWDTVNDLKGRKFKVFEFTKYSFSPEEAQWMIRQLETPVAYETETEGLITNTMIGSKYDYGQIIDLAISGALGYPDKLVVHNLDKPELIVCSVGTRLCFEKFRKENPINGLDPYPKLFSSINRVKFMDAYADECAKFADEVVEDFDKNGHVNVEVTTPAHFANSDFFNNEFKEVGRSF